MKEIKIEVLRALDECFEQQEKEFKMFKEAQKKRDNIAARRHSEKGKIHSDNFMVLYKILKKIEAYENEEILSDN